MVVIVPSGLLLLEGDRVGFKEGLETDGNAVVTWISENGSALPKPAFAASTISATPGFFLNPKPPQNASHCKRHL
jgi:hypothetical protein